MKKFLLSSVIFAVISMAANAQDAATSNTATSSAMGKEGKPQGRYEKWRGDQRMSGSDNGQNMQQGRQFGNSQMPQNNMDQKRREVIEKLTDDQKKAFKAEMERHRQAVKQITGYDLVPPAPEGNGPQGGPNGQGGGMRQDGQGGGQQGGDMRQGGGDRMRRGGGDRMPQGDDNRQNQ